MKNILTSVCTWKYSSNQWSVLSIISKDMFVVKPSETCQLPVKKSPRCAMILYSYGRKSGIILGMGSANERHCYIVTVSLIDWAHTQNDPWEIPPLKVVTAMRWSLPKGEINIICEDCTNETRHFVFWVRFSRSLWKGSTVGTQVSADTNVDWYTPYWVYQ